MDEKRGEHVAGTEEIRDAGGGEHDALPGHVDPIDAPSPAAAGAVRAWLSTTFTSLGVPNFRLFYVGRRPGVR